MEVFPKIYIAPVIGHPTYAKICCTHLQINDNLVAIHFNLRNGMLVNLGLILEPDVLDNLSKVLFNLPPNT